MPFWLCYIVIWIHKYTLYKVQDSSVLYDNEVRGILLTLLIYWSAIPSKESEMKRICVLGVTMLPLSTILIFDLGNMPTTWYFFLILLWTSEVCSLSHITKYAQWCLLTLKNFVLYNRTSTMYILFDSFLLWLTFHNTIILWTKK